MEVEFVDEISGEFYCKECFTKDKIGKPTDKVLSKIALNV
jgi:hypothetical protein